MSAAVVQAGDVSAPVAGPEAVPASVAVQTAETKQGGVGKADSGWTVPVVPGQVQAVPVVLAEVAAAWAPPAQHLVPGWVGPAGSRTPPVEQLQGAAHLQTPAAPSSLGCLVLCTPAAVVAAVPRQNAAQYCPCKGEIFFEWKQ